MAILSSHIIFHGGPRELTIWLSTTSIAPKSLYSKKGPAHVTTTHVHHKIRTRVIQKQIPKSNTKYRQVQILKGASGNAHFFHCSCIPMHMYAYIYIYTSDMYIKDIHKYTIYMCK